MDNAYFFFMDETLNERVPINIVSVVGLLVPITKFSGIRDSFYEIMSSKNGKNDNKINLAPKPLKFSGFLPEEDDEIKFKVLDQLVDLIIEHEISIYRVGYYLNTIVIGDTLPEQVAFCYLNLCQKLQPILKKNIVIPVLDAGFDKAFQTNVDFISSFQKITSQLRAASLNEMISIDNSQNLTDVFFADDKHVALIQLSDIVCGLLRESETEQVTKKEPESEYRKKMLSISKRLFPAIIYNKKIELKSAT